MKYVVVGGTSGVGLATAKMAVDAGHAVVAVGRDTGRFAAAESVGASTARLDATDAAATALAQEAGKSDVRP